MRRQACTEGAPAFHSTRPAGCRWRHRRRRRGIRSASSSVAAAHSQPRHTPGRPPGGPSPPTAMGFLQALAEWLGFDPAPGTPEHREAYFRAVKAKNDEQAKPAGQRDEAKLLELRKRVLRLGIQTVQVGQPSGGAELPPPPPLASGAHCAGGAASPLAAPAAFSTYLMALHCDCRPSSGGVGTMQACCCSVWTWGAALTARA